MREDRRRCAATRSVFIRLLLSSLQQHREDMKAQFDHADKIQPLWEPPTPRSPTPTPRCCFCFFLLLPPPPATTYHLITR